MTMSPLAQEKQDFSLHRINASQPATKEGHYYYSELAIIPSKSRETYRSPELGSWRILTAWR